MVVIMAPAVITATLTSWILIPLKEITLSLAYRLTHITPLVSKLSICRHDPAPIPHLFQPLHFLQVGIVEKHTCDFAHVHPLKLGIHN